MNRAKILSFALAISAVSLPFAASAQQVASPPSYARPSVVSDEDTVKGRVISFDGKFNLQVEDDRGYVDAVTLHQGTIINPTGITLSPGMRVTITGVNRGKALAANQIDTPYDSYAAVPLYPYYPYSPYAYGYGPQFSVGIGFGGRGGYGGFYGHRGWH